MKIINDVPPNYEEVKKHFDLTGISVVFTFGNIIYNPSKVEIGPEIIAHEEVHKAQQEEVGGPEKWWDKFLKDKEFRLQQELAAYRTQYKFVDSLEHISRKQKDNFLDQISFMLAGKMYGNLMTHPQAKSKIRNG